VISPTTEERIAQVPEAMEADMDAAVAAARKAFNEGPWPRMTPGERAAVLRRVRDEIALRLDEMVVAFTAEIGAPTGLSQAFHDRALDIWAHNADLLEAYAFDEERAAGDSTVLVVHEPVGVVATIVPWNGPVTTASLKIAPALAAGCTVVLKPAPEGPVSMMLLAEALGAAGFPEGVISVLPAGREVGEHLVRNPDVNKVSFTGSTAAGRKIMSICGERIARVTLELGGKSAALILDDVPLEDVLPTLVPAGIGHSGQICAALTRILVPRERQDEIVQAIAVELAAIQVGDPNDAETTLGPLAAERQRDRVESYIALGLEEGATLAFGGGRPDGLDRGWFIEPTLFSDVENSMRIAQEEIFGPVLSIIPYDTEEDAIKIANDSAYGLAGSVWTSDVPRGIEISEKIRTGTYAINWYAFDPCCPFGGYKNSGIGRENGPEGVEHFTQQKSVLMPMGYTTDA
jgi:acyl-CoA reductase-like NAD-dependent aldehyde dehydrogenase